MGQRLGEEPGQRRLLLEELGERRPVQLEENGILGRLRSIFGLRA